jgi:chromosome segregation ATPase
VLVQVGVTAAADSKAGEQLASHEQQQEASAEAAAAAATIADQEAVIAELRAQLLELQERFDVTQRERSNFNSKLQSMRSVLAAARCSTPSSLLSSSGLASPQHSFGVLEPVFGVSQHACVRVVTHADLAWIVVSAGQQTAYRTVWRG